MRPIKVIKKIILASLLSVILTSLLSVILASLLSVILASLLSVILASLLSVILAERSEGENPGNIKVIFEPFFPVIFERQLEDPGCFKNDSAETLALRARVTVK